MKRIASTPGTNARETYALAPSQTGSLVGWKRWLRAAIAFSFVLHMGCQKVTENVLPDNEQALDPSTLARNPSLSSQTVRELQQARAATARYQTIENAFADGYADIDVVRQNMGYHFLKSTLVDNTFDPTKPEILVYNKNHDGKQQLVALEYAVPINLTPNKAPEGFTGTDDVWKYDTEFGLWLLHAWVWDYNSDGVFNPTNPLVHLH
jgi:hypothetical protein